MSVAQFGSLVITVPEAIVFLVAMVFLVVALRRWRRRNRIQAAMDGMFRQAGDAAETLRAAPLDPDDPRRD